MQACYPLRYKPPVEFPGETAWMHRASPERNNVLSSFPGAGIYEKAKSNGDTCFFVMLAALSDRPTNHVLRLEDLYNSIFYFMIHTAAYN
jgi:hypothetical protein